MVGFLPSKMRKVFLISTAALALIMSITLYAPEVRADTWTCNQGGTVTCKQYKDQSGQVVEAPYISGPGKSFAQAILRSFMFTGTGDNKRYMMWVVSTILNPDTTQGLWDFTSLSADQSVTGDNSTIHSRLWSTNDRSCGFVPNCQGDFNPLDEQNNCQSGQAQLSSSVTVTAGVIGWTINFDPFSSCTYAPQSDIWSQYYDYTLMAGSANATKLDDTLVFSQWENNNCCGRKVAIDFAFKGQLWNIHSGLRTHLSMMGSPINLYYTY